nr:MAG TPA: hypothetical protein [Caudoviricetes sp.]
MGFLVTFSEVNPLFDYQGSVCARFNLVWDLLD